MPVLVKFFIHGSSFLFVNYLWKISSIHSLSQPNHTLPEQASKVFYQY